MKISIFIYTPDASSFPYPQALESVKKCVKPKGATVNITTVDNGWSETNHCGESKFQFQASLSRGDDYFFAVDDDAFIFEMSMMHMIETFESHEDIAIIGATLLDRQGKIVHSGGFFGPELSGVHYVKPIEHDFVDRPYVTGAYMGIRNKLVKPEWYHTELYRKYFFDAHLCCDARKSGYRVVCSSKAQATHLCGARVDSLPGGQKALYWEDERKKFASAFREAGY